MNPVQTPLQTKTKADADEATLGAGYGLLIFRLARASARHLSRSLGDTGLRWPEFVVLAHLGGQGPIAQGGDRRFDRPNPSRVRVGPSSLNPATRGAPA